MLIAGTLYCWDVVGGHMYFSVATLAAIVFSYWELLALICLIYAEGKKTDSMDLSPSP